LSDDELTKYLDQIKTEHSLNWFLILDARSNLPPPTYRYRWRYEDAWLGTQ
jgi:hypothetical protein